MDYAKAESQLYGGQRPLGRQYEYWYITAEWIPKDGAGRPKPRKKLLMGPYASEDSAQAVANEKLGNIPFEIESYNSRDRNKVAQMKRARSLNQGDGLDRSLQRMKRKI